MVLIFQEWVLDIILRIVNLLVVHGIHLMILGYIPPICSTDIQIAKIQLNDVLKDRDAYILFYARDDPHKIQKQNAEDNAASNGLHSSLSTTKVNGVAGVNGSSGKKRALDAESEDDTSKRQRLSDDDDDDLEIGKSSPLRQILTSVNKENTQITPPTIQKTYGNSTYSKINSHQDLPSSNNPHRRIYSPKTIPPPTRSIQHPSQSHQFKRGRDTSFFDALHKNDVHPKPAAFPRQTQQAPAKPIANNKPFQRPPHPLNTCIEDKEPFVAGFYGATKKQRPRYPGIHSQIQPGETSTFMKDIPADKGMMANGIKIRRKHMMK
jgi:hypothetical protein